MDEPQPLSQMEERIAFILMKTGIEPQEVDPCVYWAFGKGAWTATIYPDWYQRWHKLHPEYPVKKSDSFVKWIFAVGVAYQKHLSDMARDSLKN
ncbi:MAG: hypothetical protein KDH96_07090 [Candidatus Riesia sp.]|nr:hypothetical protein [Candidatus Riesia sp.]